MSSLTTYQPGTSVVHRTRAGAKVALLVVVSTIALVVDSPWQTVALLAFAALASALARIPRWVLVGQLKLFLPLVAVLAVYQTVVHDAVTAFQVAGDLLGVFWVASLVSDTTRATDLLDLAVWLAGPVRLVGGDPERFGLAMALGLRSVPVVLDLAREVRAAQLARGLGFSLRAFTVPLVVRSLRQADGLAEALAARGLDD